jgi:hypothetical protein
MDYFQLDCECGEKLTVPETAAGVTEECQCGRKVVVPSRNELRRRAGISELGLSPEIVVQTLLLAGKLPEEDHCVMCGAATDTVICCRTECERAYVKDGRPAWWVYVLGFLTLGWLGAALAYGSRKEDREWGKDRIFPLPLRICDGCRRELTSSAKLKTALGRVPVYRSLLEKYPDAKVSLTSP